MAGQGAARRVGGAAAWWQQRAGVALMAGVRPARLSSRRRRGVACPSGAKRSDGKGAARARRGSDSAAVQVVSRSACWTRHDGLLGSALGKQGNRAEEGERRERGRESQLKFDSK